MCCETKVMTKIRDYQISFEINSLNRSIADHNNKVFILFQQSASAFKCTL